MHEHRFRRGRPVAWFCLALAAGVPAVQARDTKAEPRLLSRAELKVCMARANALEQRHDALDKAHDEHRAEHVVLSAEAEALARQLRALDESDALAVDKYNRRNDERNQKVDKANQRADALRRAGDDLKAAQADYLAECVSRPFLQDDERALLKDGQPPFPPVRKERSDSRSTGSKDI